MRRAKIQTEDGATQTGPPARDWLVGHLAVPRGGDAPGAREPVSSTISN